MTLIKHTCSNIGGDTITNGEMIMQMFPDAKFEIDMSINALNSGWLTFKGNLCSMQVDLPWWYAQYKGGDIRQWPKVNTE